MTCKKSESESLSMSVLLGLSVFLAKRAGNEETKVNKRRYSGKPGESKSQLRERNKNKIFSQNELLAMVS